MGIETRLKTGDVQAIPLFEHALELDPNFALAAARLGGDLHEPARARAGADLHQAGVRAQRVAQRARASLHQVALPLHRHRPARRCGGDLPAVDRDVSRRLGAAQQPVDRLPAAEPARERRCGKRGRPCGSAPNSVVPYQQLTRALLALNRLAEAQEVLREARRQEPRLVVAARARVRPGVHRRRRRPRCRSTCARPASRADGYLVLTEAARAALRRRRSRPTSRTLYAQAIAAARAARITDFAGSLIAEQALDDALLGDVDRARGELAGGARPSATDPRRPGRRRWRRRSRAAPAQAAQLAAAYRGQGDAGAGRRPRVQLPMLRAAIALANNDGRRALAALSSAAPFERAAGPWLPYLRGLAYVDGTAITRAPSQQFRDVIAQAGQSADQPASTRWRACSSRAQRAPPATSPRRARPTPTSPAPGATPIRAHPLLARRRARSGGAAGRRVAVHSTMTTTRRPSRLDAVRPAVLAVAGAQPAAAAGRGARPDLPASTTSRCPFAERIGEALYSKITSQNRAMSRAFVGEWIFSHALFDWDAGARRALPRGRAAEAAGLARPQPDAAAGAAASCAAILEARDAAARVRRLVRRPGRRGAAADRRLHQRLPAAPRVARARQARSRSALPGHVHRDGRRQLRSDDGRGDGAPVSVRRRRRVGRSAIRCSRSCVARVLTGSRSTGCQGVITRADAWPELVGSARRRRRRRSAIWTRCPTPTSPTSSRSSSAAASPASWQPSVFVETSRGCWWGERMHCTFCGLNGATMAYPQQVGAARARRADAPGRRRTRAATSRSSTTSST